MKRQKTKTIPKTFRLDAKLVKLFMAMVKMRGESYKNVIEKLIGKYIKESL